MIGKLSPSLPVKCDSLCNHFESYSPLPPKKGNINNIRLSLTKPKFSQSGFLAPFFPHWALPLVSVPDPFSTILARILLGQFSKKSPTLTILIKFIIFYPWYLTKLHIKSNFSLSTLSILSLWSAFSKKSIKSV